MSEIIVNQKQDCTKISESEHRRSEKIYFRCDQWGFISKTDILLRKYRNTKHPLQIENCKVAMKEIVTCVEKSYKMLGIF